MKLSRAAALLLVGASTAIAPASASAYTVVDPIFAASDFVTNFGTCAHPPGNCSTAAPMAWSPSGKLYIGDSHTGNIYAFGPGGGSPNASNLVANAQPSCGDLTDLLFSSTGRLYMVNEGYGCGAPPGSGEVDEINPTTGAKIRTVLSGPQYLGAANLHEDPISHDLFLSQYDASMSIYRIHNPESLSPTVTTYATFGTDPCAFADGIGFGPDGTLFAVEGNFVCGSTPAHSVINRVWAIAGTNQPNAGQKVQIADTGPYSAPDGLAVGHGALLVNRNDGTITKIDLTKPGFPQSPILTGGDRGDFAILGGDGCFYASQGTKVVRISNSDGSCVLNVPSNNFTLEPRITCAGICHVVLVKITFDNAGNVTAESVLPGQSRDAQTAKKKKKKKAQVLIKPLSQVVTKGANTLQLKLTSAAIKTLKKKHKLQIPIRITFAPSGGAPNPKTQLVTLSVKVKKKKKKHHAPDAAGWPVPIVALASPLSL